MSKRRTACSRKDMERRQEAEVASEEDFPYRAINIQRE
jgi:hypothetical protein